jgi:hypothetical protein
VGAAVLNSDTLRVEFPTSSSYHALPFQCPVADVFDLPELEWQLGASLGPRRVGLREPNFLDPPPEAPPYPLARDLRGSSLRVRVAKDAEEAVLMAAEEQKRGGGGRGGEREAVVLRTGEQVLDEGFLGFFRVF